MRFSQTLKVDGLTWIYVEGSTADLDRCIKWIEVNKTLWVNAYERLVETDAGWMKDPQGSIAWAVRRTSNITDNTYQQKFCFKSPSDALRFKLSHA